MKKLVIMIGPQGSGNHLFSKMFAHNPKVGGWRTLNTNYWEGHPHEPFYDVWTGNRKLELSDFDGFDYWVTSASIPIIHKGENYIVNVVDFYTQAVDLGLEVDVAVITRDVNILTHQQYRVRGGATYPQFVDVLTSLDAIGIDYKILSHESYALLGIRYAYYCMRMFNFPEQLDTLAAHVDLSTNANSKYFHPVCEHWLDNEVHKANEESKHLD